MRATVAQIGRRAGATAVLAVAALALGARADRADAAARTATPIHHVVVVVGENHSFDNMFATYRPRRGRSIRNLRSEGIVTAGGRLGPRARRARQFRARHGKTYHVSPRRARPYRRLPRPGGDRRFPAHLPNGPYQITRHARHGARSGDPVHRFFPMYQQGDAGAADLEVWVPPRATRGALAMGYYNMARGDARLWRFVANHYATSDNYHQPIMGGTTANMIALGTGDVASYQDADGRAAVPPRLEIANPEPNGHGGYVRATEYTQCTDPSQPWVGSILGYLASRPYPPFRSGNCDPGRYYLINNREPAYLPDGTPNPNDATPPQTMPPIADELAAHGIGWAYYGQGFRRHHPPARYCPCDPFEFSRSIMTDPAQRAHIRGFRAFLSAARHGTLPAVSFVKPSRIDDGHPKTSTLAKLARFEARAADAVISNRSLFVHTAILLTMDEGGGFYDSGYVQPIDFFGDGPRIPMQVISPYAPAGRIDHTYADHASVLKFIERNWHLSPLSRRSRDNLPDPTRGKNAYVPGNRPAIGDLGTLFDFGHRRGHPPLLPRR